MDAGEGFADWQMPASEWFCTAARGFYGGAVALLADGTMVSAVATTVDAGTAFATLSFTCSFLRPVQPDGRPLMAKARVAHRGRTIAMCTAEITDADGKRVAMASSSSMIVPTERWRRGEMVPPLDESPVRGDANAAPA